jgi:hypothetical protein
MIATKEHGYTSDVLWITGAGTSDVLASSAIRWMIDKDGLESVKKG